MNLKKDIGLHMGKGSELAWTCRKEIREDARGKRRIKMGEREGIVF